MSSFRSTDFWYGCTTRVRKLSRARNPCQTSMPNRRAFAPEEKLNSLYHGVQGDAQLMHGGPYSLRSDPNFNIWEWSYNDTPQVGQGFSQSRRLRQSTGINSQLQVQRRNLPKCLQPIRSASPVICKSAFSQQPMPQMLLSSHPTAMENRNDNAWFIGHAENNDKVDDDTEENSEQPDETTTGGVTFPDEENKVEDDEATTLNAVRNYVKRVMIGAQISETDREDDKPIRNSKEYAQYVIRQARRQLLISAMDGKEQGLATPWFRHNWTDKTLKADVMHGDVYEQTKQKKQSRKQSRKQSMKYSRKLSRKQTLQMEQLEQMGKKARILIRPDKFLNYIHPTDYLPIPPLCFLPWYRKPSFPSPWAKITKSNKQQHTLDMYAYLPFPLFPPDRALAFSYQHASAHYSCEGSQGKADWL